MMIISRLQCQEEDWPLHTQIVTGGDLAGLVVEADPSSQVMTGSQDSP